MRAVLDDISRAPASRRKRVKKAAALARNKIENIVALFFFQLYRPHATMPNTELSPTAPFSTAQRTISWLGTAPIKFTYERDARLMCREMMIDTLFVAFAARRARDIFVSARERSAPRQYAGRRPPLDAWPTLAMRYYCR